MSTQTGAGIPYSNINPPDLDRQRTFGRSSKPDHPSTFTRDRHDSKTQQPRHQDLEPTATVKYRIIHRNRRITRETMGCGQSRPQKHKTSHRGDDLHNQRTHVRENPYTQSEGSPNDEPERGRHRVRESERGGTQLLEVPSIVTYAPSSRSNSWEPTFGFTESEQRWLPRSDDLAQQFSIHRGRAPSSRPPTSRA